MSYYEYKTALINFEDTIKAPLIDQIAALTEDNERLRDELESLRKKLGETAAREAYWRGAYLDAQDWYDYY